MTHTVYIAFQLFVSIDGNIGGKICISSYLIEVMTGAIFGILSLGDKISEYTFLQLVMSGKMLLKTLLSRQKSHACYTG